MNYAEGYKEYLDILKRLDKADEWFIKNKDLPEDDEKYIKSWNMLVELINRANELYCLIY